MYCLASAGSSWSSVTCDRSVFHPGNVSYTGSRRHYFGNGYHNMAQASAAAALYPRGRNITVYYDPTDPTRAVLERALPSPILPFSMIALFVAIGVFVLRLGMYGGLQKQTAPTTVAGAVVR